MFFIFHEKRRFKTVAETDNLYSISSYPAALFLIHISTNHCPSLFQTKISFCRKRRLNTTRLWVTTIICRLCVLQ